MAKLFFLKQGTNERKIQKDKKKKKTLGKKPDGIHILPHINKN